MSEQSNCPTINVAQADFNALEVLKSHSTKIERLPEWNELNRNHFHRDGQAELGFQSHDVFVSKTDLGTFVFAVIEYRNPDDTAPITKNTLFTVEIRVKYAVVIPTERGTKTQWRKFRPMERLENIPLVDLVKCQFEDGTEAVVGLLCIPIEPCWTVSDNNPFKNIDQKFKFGVAIKGRYESNEGIKYPVQQNRSDKRSIDSQQTEARNSLSLTSGVWQLHKKDNQENYLLMCVTHGDSKPYPLTSATPIKVKLTLRSIAKHSEHLVAPYHTSISIEPWFVKKENGYFHGLLAIPLPVSTEKEARFFEVVTKIPGSFRLEFTTLEREH
ncbi:uncharacterized protein BHQ10_009227 [Talaromyces amestolkiae]|uniref:Uncharacterized protein n=1 Tax=Talaromyces amestolkiae TaxID=1196081 RepID=A0A364LBL2_TALAM|nr:uncharacterized protein BHQ10_009227 [Talaromyces amestolkiae]RAO73215.1 hypothetical protein BHQ10_009227 [Talaromyces amestolkiae]